MNNENLIVQVYNSQELKDFFEKYIKTDLKDDIKQFCFLKLLETKKEINKGFIFSFIYKTYIWQNGEFYRQLGREVLCDNFPDVEDDYDNIEIDIEHLYWYKKEVLKLYAKIGNLRELSKQTHIPVASLHRTITDARKEIKQKL